MLEQERKYKPRNCFTKFIPSKREKERGGGHWSSARVKNLQRAARDQLTPGWPFRSLQPPLGWGNETRRVGTRRSSRKPRLESRGKRQGYYTQRGVSSARGKAWSGDARRPFVSCASRTRNALASHGHRSRLPLTSRIVPRLCTLYAHLTLLRVRIYAHVLTRTPAFFIPLSLSAPFSPRRTGENPSEHILPFPSIRPSAKEPELSRYTFRVEKSSPEKNSARRSHLNRH